jgi:hypothetical protein
VRVVGHRNGLSQELARDRPVEQALPVLGEGGGVPRRRLQVKADKPAEEQVVLELLDQLPLAPDRVEQLQQQGPQQLFRRDRRAPGLAVQRRELGREVAQDRVDEATDHPQRMVRRDPVFQDHRRKHHSLCAFVTPHPVAPIEVAPVYEMAPTTPEGFRPFSAAC